MRRHTGALRGLGAPRGKAHGPLVESVAGQWVMRFMAEAKALPASVFNRKVDEKAEHTEMTEGRKPGKKEKRDLKDEAKLDLLPMKVGEVLPSLLRDWVSEMDCTSKAIRNMLTRCAACLRMRSMMS